MQDNIQQLRRSLEAAQESLQRDPLNSTLISRETRERILYKSLLSREESMIRQKSRQNWLQLGDSNSAFFYASFAGRKAQNTLRRVILPNGNISEDPALVKAHVVSYFSELLNRPCQSNDRQIVFKSTLSDQDAGDLIAEVSEEEIYNTLMQMKQNGSPGPDGFNPYFFRSCWDVVGIDVHTLNPPYKWKTFEQSHRYFPCLLHCPDGEVAWPDIPLNLQRAFIEQE
ncbi:hypothetical protein QJS10_CPA10g00686 [Acorus calamus]|uniref:Reverse transcriptase n=1 Tax=Acorus calamus TaxID=4465 RepID=A0AAV9DXD0_ACOCL|nr:hypothetical protein QJS10_CPA10g00686 [Acorus calamus]